MLIQQNLSPDDAAIRYGIFEDVFTFVYGHNHQQRLHSFFYKMSENTVRVKNPRSKKWEIQYAEPVKSVKECMDELVGGVMSDPAFTDRMLSIDMEKSIQIGHPVFTNPQLISPLRGRFGFLYESDKFASGFYKSANHLPKSVFGAFLRSVWNYQHSISKIGWLNALWRMVSDYERRIFDDLDTSVLYDQAHEDLYYIMAFANMMGDQEIIKRVMQTVMRFSFVSSSGIGRMAIMQHFEHEREYPSRYMSSDDEAFRNELSEVFLQFSDK